MRALVWRGLDPDPCGWYRLEEGARRLHVSPAFVRYMARRGFIRRRWMFKGWRPRPCVNARDLVKYAEVIRQYPGIVEAVERSLKK